MNEDLLNNLQSLTSALEKSAKELDIKIYNKESLLDEKLINISETLKRANEKEKKLDYMISKLEETLSSFNSKIEDISKNIESASLKTEDFRSDVKQIEEKMESFKDLQVNAEKAQKTIENFNKDTVNIHNDIVNLSEKASACNDSYRTMQKSFDKMKNDINNFMSSDLGKLTTKDDIAVKKDFARYVKDHLVAEGTFSDSKLIWK